MKKIILILGMVMLVPLMANAGGEGEQFKNQMSVGAGYYIPREAPPGVNILNSKFDAQLPRGLDCSGLDLRAQLKSELSSGLSMKDLEAMGSSALAASASYLAASFRPTWYESYQNLVKQANKQVQANVLECRSMEQNLKESDPLGLYSKNQQATKAVELANAGVGWEAAKTQAGDTETTWKLKNSLATSSRPIEQKANLLAVMGDISFTDAGGKSAAGGDQTDAGTLDAVYLSAHKVIAQAVRDRFNGSDDCAIPLFAGEADTEARALWMKGLEENLARHQNGEAIKAINREEAWLFSMQHHLAAKLDPWTGCGAVASWREDYLAEDRAEVLEFLASAQTVRAIGLVLHDANAELRQFKIANPDQSSVVDELSPLPQLFKNYAALREETLERERMARSLVAAHRRADQERREAASKRQSGKTTFKGAPSPAGRF